MSSGFIWMYGIGPAVHDEIALLVEIGALPYVVGAAIVDEKGEFLRFLLLAWRLQSTPLRRHERRLSVLRAEFAVGEKTLRPDQLAILEAGRRFLDAVGSHGAQPFIGDEFAALGVAVIPVHEGVFFGLPIEALELVGYSACLPISRNTRSRLLARRAAMRQSGMAWPGGSM